MNHSPSGTPAIGTLEAPYCWPQRLQSLLPSHQSLLRSSYCQGPVRQALGGPGGRRAVIGRQGARPLIPARREGAGPAGCPAPGLRAPIDPTAAAAVSSSSWRAVLERRVALGKPALPLVAAAAISAFSGREGGGVLTAAAGAGSSPGTVLSVLSALPPSRRRPPPCALRVQLRPGREKVGEAGAGRGRGTDTHTRGKSWIAAPRSPRCTPAGPPQ